MNNRFEFKKYIVKDDNGEEKTELRIVDNAGIRDILCLQEDFAGLLLTTLFGDGIEPFLELLEEEGLYNPDDEEYY